MSYGYKILNQYGEEVTDNNKAMTVVESGNLLDVSTILTASWNLAIADGHVPSPGAASFATDNFSTFFALPGSRITSTAAAFYKVDGRYIISLEMRPILHELAFFQLGGDKGIYRSGQFFSTIPGLPAGQVHTVDMDGTGPFPYIISGLPVSPNPSGTHGIQLFDETGATVFDSRVPLLSVFDAIYIPKATFESVLTTGTPVTLTMRESVANVMFACPYYCPFQTVNRSGEGWSDLALISQISPNTLQISRRTSGPLTTYTTRSFSHDAIVFLARPVS